MAAIEDIYSVSTHPINLEKGTKFIDFIPVYKDVVVAVYKKLDDYLWYIGGQLFASFTTSARADIKHMVMVSIGGESTRYHFSQEPEFTVPLLAIQGAFTRSLGPRYQVDFLLNSRFKINGKERTLIVNQNKLASGVMNTDVSNWQGRWYGRNWKVQLGEDFKLYLLEQFDLNWAHKVVCQKRGEYQFLPYVALFFDSPTELVVKLVNRPNEKDHCDGFYVGRLFGQGFGYHLDGNADAIPRVDDYFRRAISDIVGSDLPEGALETDRFIVDIAYSQEEDRWLLTSNVGVIGELVKGVTPTNTCAVRKYVTWKYDIFGSSIKDIPLLENLLINAFHRTYEHYQRQQGIVA